MSAAYRSDAYRQGLITLFLIAMIILVAWLLLWPAYGGWRDAGSELAAARPDLASRQATLDSFERLISNYNANKSELSVLETSLPSAPKVPQLISNLESLVIQSSLLINSIKITDPTQVEESFNPAPKPALSADKGIPNPSLVELNIEMTLEGDYGLFRGFLDTLERNQRLLEVRSVAASPVSGSGQGTGAAFGLVLTTSYQK